MGYQPVPPRPTLTPESMLRAAFIAGRIDVDQFEDAMGEALQGVWTKTTALCLPKPGGLPPLPAPDVEARS